MDPSGCTALGGCHTGHRLQWANALPRTKGIVIGMRMSHVRMRHSAATSSFCSIARLSVSNAIFGRVSKTVGWLTTPAWTVHEILTDNIPFLGAVCHLYDVPYNSCADLSDQL